MIFVFFGNIIDLRLPPIRFAVAAGLKIFNANIFLDIIEITITSILIPFQLKIIHLMLVNSNFSFIGIKFKLKEIEILWHSLFEKSFKNFYYRYATILLIITPALLFIKVRNMSGEPIFLNLKPLSWEFFYSLYNELLGLLIFYLMAMILWIIIMNSLLIKVLGSSRYRDDLYIESINADNLGGLGELKNLVLNGFFYYSLCVTLAIFTYMRPKGFIKTSFLTISFSYEIIYLIFLLLIGLIFSILSLCSIKNILNYKIKLKFRELNEKFEKQYNKLQEIASKEVQDISEIDLYKTVTMLNIINNEKDRIMTLSLKNYGIKYLTTLLVTFIYPIILKILENKILSLAV